MLAHCNDLLFHSLATSRTELNDQRFNIGACDLRTERPSASIDSFLNASSRTPIAERSKSITRPEHVPEDVWHALDSATRRELFDDWQSEQMIKSLQPQVVTSPTHLDKEEYEEWMDTDDYS